MKASISRSCLNVSMLLSALCVADVHAASVTWGPAQQISGDSDVLNAGTTDRAYLFAADPGPTHTINGVTFAQFIQTAGTDTSTFTNRFTGAFGSAAPPFSSLSNDLQITLSSGAYRFGAAANLTLTGLTVGELYHVQLWMNDSRATANVAKQTVSGSPILAGNSTGQDGGLGQFVVGSFVADATQQALTFEPQNSANASIYLNMLQLRTGVVPEPTSLLIVAVAGVVVLARCRFSRILVAT